MNDDNLAYSLKKDTLNNPTVHETEYLRFVWSLRSIQRKTEIWGVESQRGLILGRIMWYPRWRCYAFYPEPETLFNAQCLQEIRDFISAEMLERG